jgi:hypothetical protein
MMPNPFRQRQIIATAADGRPIPAVLMGCKCGGERFHYYIITGGHTHLQCTACGEAYCDGACVPPADRGLPLDPRD